MEGFPACKPIRGFSLTELLFVVAIISALTLVIAPGMSGILSSQRLDSDISSLRNLIRSTRHLALQERTWGVICPTSNQQNCSGDWNLPLMVFLDENNNRKRDEKEFIRHRFNSATSPEMAVLDYPRTQIRFTPQGSAQGYNGTLSLCSGKEIKGLVVSMSGRVRWLRQTDIERRKSESRSTFPCPDPL